MRILSRIHGWKLPLIGAVGLVFALVSVLGRPASQAHAPLVTPPTTSFSTQVAGIGVVEPMSEVINLGVELPGVVRQVQVAVGDDVKRGAPLFTLDQREVDAQIATLEASLASSRVQAADAAAQYALIASVKDKRAVARDEVNRRQFAKQLAQARVKEIEAQLQQAKTTKQRLSVKAPIDGRVLELNVRPGEYAPAGVLAAPLVRMGDVSRLHVRVEVDEENAARIRPDSKAEGLFRGDTATRIPLTFVRFEPYVRAKQNLAVAGQRVDTRVLQIIYALPEAANDRFVGQQMDVFVDEATTTGKGA
jgi:HlyD family secretion protein